MIDWKPLIDIFLEKNAQINLSAIRDADGVRIKHILDSIELNKILTLKKGSWVCDLGTGGGFPLLPLAMTNPDVHFLGIDSVRKKVNAVNEMIQALHIKNAKAYWTRMEEFKGQSFDYITSRAVGYVDKIIDWSYHLLKAGGCFVFYKIFSAEEKKDLFSLCQKKGMRIIQEHKYTLFEGDIERVIYVVEKNKSSVSLYSAASFSRGTK